MGERNAKEREKSAHDSWIPGQKGQGGEGMSKGYGGSAGEGTGASGPEDGKRPQRRHDEPHVDKS